MFLPGLVNFSYRIERMNKAKIYVGNLSYDTTEDGIRSYFNQYGNIDDVKLIKDFQTGRSKGFAFVTYASDQEGEHALAANGTQLDGRTLNVNTARDTNTGGGGRRPGGSGAPGGGRGGRYNERGYGD